jgi:hypothetical protein
VSTQCAGEFPCTSHRRGLPLIQTHYRGSWVEIVEVGMVASGIIKEGAVLSWEGIQYCGTPGFKVCVCCECMCAVFLPVRKYLTSATLSSHAYNASVLFCNFLLQHRLHKHSHNRPIGRCPR